MRGRAGRLLPVAAAVVLALGAAARAPAQTIPCEASAKVKEALRNLPASTGDAQSDRAARLAALKALVRRFPNDVFVHQRYQDTVMYPDVKDLDSLSSYGTLWALEFRVRPATEHDALRKQVAEDLKRLRTVDPGKGATLYYVLQEGYELVSDKEGVAWVSDQRRKLPGAGSSAAQHGSVGGPVAAGGLQGEAHAGRHLGHLVRALP